MPTLNIKGVVSTSKRLSSRTERPQAAERLKITNSCMSTLPMPNVGDGDASTVQGYCKWLYTYVHYIYMDVCIYHIYNKAAVRSVTKQ